MTQPTTTYHPVCPQWYSQFQVAPSSGIGKGYMVIINGPGGMHFCTCPAYRYSGGYGEQNCKHIDMVFMYGCLYQGSVRPGTNTLNAYGIELLSSAQNTTTESCPGCGELMISTGREDG